VNIPDTNQLPLGYEEARQQLVDVVAQLESGGVPLAESMQLWERGEKLAAICQQWLDGAKAKVQQARAQQAGAPQSGTAQPDVAQPGTG
jgi:exodeoxyribonuclease VII small subunit